MHEFENFMKKLSADTRLGRFLPAPRQHQTAETVILALVIALAEAHEASEVHPAHRTLEELDNRAPAAVNRPIAPHRIGPVIGRK
jgi:hypothetical protein